MAWGSVARSAWSDKFQMPSLQDLRLGLAKPLQSVFDDAREAITELDGISEQLAWQGVPWRWTLVYNLTEQSGEGRSLAYLVPDPQRLQICVPLTQEQIEKLPIKRMKKSIRDGVVFARSVAGVWWPTWEIASKAALDEVLELVTKKHKFALESAAVNA